MTLQMLKASSPVAHSGLNSFPPIADVPSFEVQGLDARQAEVERREQAAKEAAASADVNISKHQVLTWWRCRYRRRCWRLHNAPSGFSLRCTQQSR